MWLIALGVLAGCEPDRSLLEVPIRTVPTVASFDLADGVSIELDIARATLSDLRLEQPAQTTALAWLSPIATATAHPGHDFTGNVAGELLGEWQVDWLAASQELGVANAYAGSYATARLTIPSNAQIELSGVAWVDGGEVPFDLVVVPDQELTGLAFTHELDAQQPFSITLAFDAAHALSFVDWRTEDTDGDGMITTQDGAIANTSRFGITSTPTWLLTLVEAP